MADDAPPPPVPLKQPAASQRTAVMEQASLRTAVLWTLLSVAVVLAGCAAPREAENGDGQQPARSRAAAAPAGYVEMDLAAPSDRVRTIQLYPGADESRPPVVEMGSGGRLTLEFDLLAEAGRPLSLFFYHADRRWRRDLSPSEYLDSFHRDDALDYAVSLATEIPYVHYEYAFPNADIDFRLSGNYVVRVTEQGREDEILFERPFFVSEQATPVDFVTDNVMLGGAGFPATQPVATFRPPPDDAGNVFDYNVCFVRNGRFDLARCADRPSLAQQPFVQFYLEPELSFEPQGASYFLDLSYLRPGPQIGRVDRTATPYAVTLEPDYARFGSSGLGPLLSGQTVVGDAVRDVARADTEAEYVAVQFSYVPDGERPLAGEVVLVGSFSGWQFDPANEMAWSPEARRYEVEVLLKQGLYEYRYMVRDRRAARLAAGTMPRVENAYTALVYYRDLRVNTDRLLAVRQVLGR